MKQPSGPVLAIIPARGGSKGVVRKNLRLIAGTSLLARAVASAQAVGIDSVVVSTDDAEIAAAAAAAGAPPPFLREPDLASDTASSEAVIFDAISRMEAIAGYPFSTIVLLEPTSPFRTAAHVQASIERYARQDVACVITVCAVERKPSNIFVKGEHLERYVKAPNERFRRRQDMAHLCRLNSAVYVFGRDRFMATGAIVADPIGFVEMAAVESVNIDDGLDLAWANFLVEQNLVV